MGSKYLQEEEDNDNLFEHYRITIDPKQEPIRIDRFLMDRIPNTTRNKIQEAIVNDFILVNNDRIKANYKVRPGDEIRVVLPTPPRDSVVIPEDIPLDIQYEDDQLLIVNKPAHMVVHPAYNNWTGTLVNGLAYHFDQLPTLANNEGRPGLVHRIDKGTSGLLVIAKTESAINSLAKQFLDHTIDRTYWALIWGEPEESEGTINVNIDRDPKDRRIRKAFPEGTHGKHAITHYKVLKRLRYVSLIECHLETGRTHQIRVHLKYLGHPLFGDTKYGGDKLVKGEQFSKYKAFVENNFKVLNRQALHAKSLGFNHPGTGNRVFFDSELPEDFESVLTRWEAYVKYN